MKTRTPPDTPVRGASPPTPEEIFKLRSVAGGSMHIQIQIDRLLDEAERRCP